MKRVSPYPIILIIGLLAFAYIAVGNNYSVVGITFAFVSGLIAGGGIMIITEGVK